MTKRHSTTTALERCLAGAQRLATATGDPESILYTAQARLIALRRCPAEPAPRRGRLRLAAVNGLVRVAWFLWDAAQQLR